MKKLKRLLSLIMVLIIVLSSVSVFAENKQEVKFKDIKSSDWYSSSVTNLTRKGAISGYNDGTFRPNNSVTTAEYLKLAMETAGVKIDYNTTPWNKGIMDKALSLNIITKDLYSKPNAPVKRQDVALILAKLIEKTELKNEFITERSKEYDRFKYLLYDTTKLSQEYRDSIYKLFEYQLIVGSTNNKEQVFYNPDSNLIRAEVAAIIERLIEPSKRLDKYAEYPNRDSIFAHKDIDDMTSTYHIKADTANQRFLYTYDEGNGVIEDVVLSEKLNPNINKQIYELTKATLDKDRNYFVAVTPGFYNTEDSKVSYQVAKTRLHAMNYNQIWMFTFDEDTPYNIKEDFFNFKNSTLSKNAVISLRLGKIWQDFAPNGWVDWFYANKLRASFIALFGEKNGHEIYEYVLDEYLKYRLAGSAESTGHKLFYKTKEIGNIHIDYITGDNSTLRFHFSYLK